MRTLLICCVLGVLVAAAYTWATLYGLTGGLAGPWQQLPDVPQPVTALADAQSGTVAVLTSDNVRLFCTPSAEPCWSEQAEPPEDSVPTERCGFDTVTGFVLSHRGAGIVSCRAVAAPYGPDGSRIERVVLDRSGAIWYQQWVVSPGTALVFSLANIPFGAIAGLAVGVVILLIRGRFADARR